MKKYVGLFLLWTGVMASVSSIAHGVQTCQRSDFFCYESGPSGNLSTPARLDSSGNLFLNGNLASSGTVTISGTGTQTIPGTIFQGTTGVVITTLPVAGNSLGIYVPATLAAGSANPAVEGSVLIASTTLTGVTVVVSTGAGQTSVVGIAQAAASTGAVVNMYTSGWVLALASGTVTEGDVLVTSFTATGNGYLATNNSTSVAYQGVAIAAGPNTSGSRNLIKVKMIH